MISSMESNEMAGPIFTHSQLITMVNERSDTQMNFHWTHTYAPRIFKMLRTHTHTHDDDI